MNSIANIKTWAEELAAMDAVYRGKIDSLVQTLHTTICDLCGIPKEAIHIRFNETSGVFCIYIKQKLTEDQDSKLAEFSFLADEAIFIQTPFVITCAYTARKKELPEETLNDGT